MGRRSWLESNCDEAGVGDGWVAERILDHGGNDAVDEEDGGDVFVD